MSDAEKLHEASIILDGLVIAKWDRALFQDMAKGD